MTEEQKQENRSNQGDQKSLEAKSVDKEKSSSLQKYDPKLFSQLNVLLTEPVVGASKFSFFRCGFL